MDKRKLLSNYYMIVRNITFASDAIGFAAPDGRSADTAWDEGDIVIFRGQLRHLLIFGLMAFDINPASLTSPEDFSVIPESKYVDSANPAGVRVIDLNPATSAEGIVLLEDVTFLEEITGKYRHSWDDSVGIVVESKSDPTDKTLYHGTRLAALAYGLQYQDSEEPAVLYSSLDFAFFDRSNVSGLDNIHGSNGPIELSKAHLSIGHLILGS